MHNNTGQGQAMESGARDAGKPVRVIQITDTHLYRHPAGALLGLNTQESFVEVVKLIARQQNDPDVIVATGDIAQDASAEAYLRFADTISTLAAPFYWIPGNHDRLSVMKSLTAYEDAFTPCIRRGNWQIIMLDTSHPGDVHGQLCDEELQKLERYLAEAGSAQTVQHSMVCLHHNPIAGSAGWMEGIGLHNADDFLAILQRYDSVRAVVYGHIHQSLDFIKDGIRFFCTPSTCIQFKPDAKEFALDLLCPAYRWFDLGQDGSIDTRVERLQNFELTVDRDADGY